ncbi:hypothetical protein J1605_019471 [Eschrichtius robustus]|uniref:FDFT1 n=1 Tax=Eschrichtius robustus TaxID=9764 RepID=A0AB34HMS5_ESCRO|nr:hypothetical protein J1605_019471 [Eschrichtius robustus]
MWSSRQTHPTADWPASCWCERPWPISARQSTPRARGQRRERLRPVEVGGEGPAQGIREVSSEVRRFAAAASMEFVKCLGHPEEFYNLLRFQMGGRQKVIPKMDQSDQSLLPQCTLR